MDSTEITHVWIVNRTEEVDPLYVFVEEDQAREFAARYRDATVSEEVVMNAHSGARFLTDTYEPDEDDDEPETTLDTGAVKTLDALRNSIAAVVDYSFRAEHADYERQRPENREGHVFEHLRTLRRFLTGDAVTPAGEPEPDDHSSRQEDGRNAADDLERVLTRAIADARALDAIAHMLRDPDWGVGILEDAAAIVSETGRSLDNPTGDATWPRH